MMKAGTSPWGNDISVHAGRKLLAFSGKTRIVLMNVAILLKVGAGAFAGFLAIVAFGRILDAKEARK